MAAASLARARMVAQGPAASALALLLVGVVPGCGAARLQPAPAALHPDWLMWSVGAVVVSGNRTDVYMTE